MSRRVMVDDASSALSVSPRIRVLLVQPVIRPSHRTLPAIVAIDHPDGLFGRRYAARTTPPALPAPGVPSAAHAGNVAVARHPHGESFREQGEYA